MWQRGGIYPITFLIYLVYNTLLSFLYKAHIATSMPSDLSNQHKRTSDRSEAPTFDHSKFPLVFTCIIGLPKAAKALGESKKGVPKIEMAFGM